VAEGQNLDSQLAAGLEEGNSREKQGPEDVQYGPEP